MLQNDDLVRAACKEREALVRTHLQHRRLVRAAQMQREVTQPHVLRRVSHWAGGLLVATGRRLQMSAEGSSGLGKPTG